MSTRHEDQVRARAFAIWEAEGRPVGHDMEHWLAAEREIMNEKSGNGGAPADAIVKSVKAPRKRQAGAEPARTTRKKKEVL
jgi:hypothetical protein